MKKLFVTLLFMINLCFSSAIPHLYILSLNGINTTRDDALENAKKLKQVPPINSNMITFSFVWNPTKGGSDKQTLWNNIQDVAQQKAFEGKSSMTFRFIYHIY